MPLFKGTVYSQASVMTSLVSINYSGIKGFGGQYFCYNVLLSGAVMLNC